MPEKARFAALIERFSSELRFVVLACRWPMAASHAETLRAAGDAVTDWPAVLAIATAHRVRGLVYAATVEARVALPDDAMARLSAMAHDVCLKALRTAAAAIRVDRLLTGAGIEHVIVKGAPLAQLAYGRQEVKESLDVDVVVRAASVRQAFATLTQSGYSCIYPGDLSDDAIDEWGRFVHEATWSDPSNGTLIDLHWRMTASHTLLPGIGIDTPRVNVAVADGVTVQTFEKPALAAYLCVHGAEHSWVRLKWLADLAALLGGMSPDERDALVSDHPAARHCIVPALTLCRDLLGRQAPARVDAMATVRDRALVALAGRAIRRQSADRTRRSAFGHIPHGLAPVLFETGAGAAWRRIGAVFVNPIDRAHGRFPASMAWLYPFARIGQWIARKTGMVLTHTLTGRRPDPPIP